MQDRSPPTARSGADNFHEGEPGQAHPRWGEGIETINGCPRADNRRFWKRASHVPATKRASLRRVGKVRPALVRSFAAHNGQFRSHCTVMTLRYSDVRMVTEQSVLAALKNIKDPDAQRDIVGLGLVRDLAIHDAEVSFTLAFTTQSPGTKANMHSMASRIVGQLPGVSKVQVKMGSGSATAGG